MIMHFATLSTTTRTQTVHPTRIYISRPTPVVEHWLSNPVAWSLAHAINQPEALSTISR